MRLAATAVLLIAFATTMALSGAGQDGSPARPPGQRPRIPTVLSEMLLHSPLVTCGGGVTPATTASKRLRVGTWNIQAGQSAPVDAIATVLRDLNADVIALQEVDVKTRRAGYVDQPTTLATTLGLEFVFAASIKWDEGDYGLAVLSRFPLAHIERHRVEDSSGGEPRIVLDVTVCVDGRPLRLLNHHADRRVNSRAAGFEALRSLAQAERDRGLLILGDLNEFSDAPGIRSLVDAGFVDLGAGENVNTTGSGRIDFILADNPIAARMSAPRVWTTDKSDHHAVLANLDW